MNAIATLLLCCAVPSPAEDLAKAVGELKKGDTKLKAAYQQLLLGHKKMISVSEQLAATARSIDVLNAQIANITDRMDPLGRTRGNLRSQVHDLQRQKAKLEKDKNAKQETLRQLEEAFKAEEEKTLGETNRLLVPILTSLKIGDDRRAMDAVMSMFDLFVFDDYREMPTLRIGSALLDQEVMQAAGHCLATSGTRQLGDLKKGLSRSIATRYAIILAVTEIGPEADRADKDIYSILFRQKAQLSQNTTLQRQDKEARIRLIQKALETLRP